MFKKIIVVSDHRVENKYLEKIKQILDENKITSEFVNDNDKSNDYPSLVEKAMGIYNSNKFDGMILLCGTGVGMNMVANKFDGIRATLVNSEAEAYFSRRHENANAIAFGTGYNDGIYEVKPLCRRKMARIINVFLTTDFEGDRHKRRINKIKEIEKDN